jgi:hypothetical protein
MHGGKLSLTNPNPITTPHSSVGAIQENTNLPIIQMQQILLLTGDVKSKILSHSALPGWSKLFVQSVFDQDRCTLVVFGG